MTTYVICEHCQKKFKSPIQVVDLKNNAISNNKTNCPICKKITKIENSNLINLINLETAMVEAKKFLEKMKGLNLDLGGRKYIDWLEFEVDNVEENDENFILKCKIKEDLFSHKEEMVLFEFTVNKLTGEVDDFKRL